jgi:penicillin-binding protein 2
LFDEFKERFFNFITSRLTVLIVLLMLATGVLVYRCFDLQIVQGAEYLSRFMLQTEKTRDIASSRGGIYDRNGVPLAYNELAYSVKIEDVYESGTSKNSKLNTTISTLIRMIEKHGDHIITDFGIALNEDGEYDFSVTGTSLLRFLADVYGITYVEDLTDEQRLSTPDEIMEYLGGTKRFAVGDYREDENGKDIFVVGLGYTRQELLKMITIRYAMSLTAFRKYMGTTVATDISEETMTVIMENADKVPGVTIEPDTIRRYTPDSVYFAHLLGYTGKISSEELESLNTQYPDRYSLNDLVGKNGIEAYMESELQGLKGSEKVSVDNMGKVISILERTESSAGNDVYLTIDYDLQIATYHILEERIAGIVADKIINAKEYIPADDAQSRDIRIPIYDVYFALINNSVLDIRLFAEEEASETEKEVYQSYVEYRDFIYDELMAELIQNKTPYNKLSKEYQVYQSNIVSLLNREGIIDSSKVNADDPVQNDWAVKEVISLSEYLAYCIAQNWIDVTQLTLDSVYSDSQELFEKLCDTIIDLIDNNLEFQKRFYKYMLQKDIINGKQICKLLCEQNAAEIPEEEEESLYQDTISAYQFMMNRIQNLDITPAQLALDPCNGSVVIVDNHTGDVLAMVSYPGYDNNKMANSVDAAYYAKLMADKSTPSLNFATQYKAAPGSTYKMVTATAGLMEGAIGLDTVVRCTGVFTEITPSPRCWSTWGHGNQNVTSAITNSCNYFFYQVGYNLAFENGQYHEDKGINLLAKYADLYGLSEKSGVEVTEYEPDVSDEYPVHSAIGQGANSYTTVGLARYVAAVANGGTCYNLTLLDKMTDSEKDVLEEYAPEIRNTIDMPQAYWNAIHTGMRGVVQNKAYFSDLAVNVAGKTGTAEQTASRPSHALFVCYAPYEDPEITIATRIPFGYSSDYAAQTTRDIIEYYYGLADRDELITGTADDPEAGVSMNEM